MFDFVFKLRRYFIFIIRISPSQIFHRLKLFCKRRVLVFLYSSDPKFSPIYVRTNISLREDYPVGSILNTTPLKKCLPIEVDLVGTKYFIEENLNWFDKELNIGTRLEKMNLHYMYYLYELQINHFKTIILEWINKVFPYQNDYWLDTWNCYSLSIRIINWIDLLTFYLDNQPEDMEDEFTIRIRRSIILQTKFLVNNLELDIGGNHLIKNIRCLFRSASLFNTRESKEWIDLASNLLDKELDRQVLNDGMHFELSPSYHINVMEDLLCINRSLNSLIKIYPTHKINNLTNKLRAKLFLMSFPLVKMTHPDGFPSLFADGGMNMSTMPSKIIDILIKDLIITEEYYKGIFSSFNWSLANAGYYGLSNRTSLFIIDCGEVCAHNLPAHGQGDGLSIEWSVNNKRFIIDPGVYEYHSGKRRDYSRSSYAHNTITLNNLDQSEFWSSFKVGRRAKINVEKYIQGKDFFEIKATSDAYSYLEGKPKITREVVADFSSIDVHDQISYGSNQVAKSTLLLAPDVRIISLIKESNNQYICRMSNKNDNDLHPNILMRSDVPITVEKAIYFPDFGQEAYTLRLVLFLGNAPCIANWSISFL